MSMRIAKESDKEQLLNYLEKDLGNCLYIYLDIMQYGLNGENIKVWMSEGKKPNTVLMQYHGDFQIYSTNLSAGEEKEIIGLIMRTKAGWISGEKKVIDIVAGNLYDTYKLTEGWVYELTSYRSFEYPEGFGIAKKEDMRELAALVCSDKDVGGGHHIDDLEKQFIERLKIGMGRNYYVRKNGEIISHIATYAENDKLAITSGMVTREDMRKEGYSSILEGCLVNDLLKEGKRVFTRVNQDRRARFLQIMGAEKCGEYARLQKI